jgi:hypothetical protein
MFITAGPNTQLCARRGRKIVEDVCYGIVRSRFLPSYYPRGFRAIIVRW